MTTNLKFPSNKDKEIDFTPGFTARERKCLSRRKKVPVDFDFVDWFLFFVLVASIVFLGMLIQRAFFTPKAEAHEPRENSYYCAHLNEYTSEDMEEIRSYCAEEYGIPNEQNHG
jgi:hypothetical protein